MRTDTGNDSLPGLLRALPARATGFTLIELMITVAIIGILIAIAYPSYTESVRKGQRAEARTILLEAAQFMQRSYANNDTFAGAALPASLTRSPQAGTQLYTISIVAGATRTTYTLQAVPGGILASDKCGTLTLNNAGQRGATGTYGAANCWK